ncbi:hypothetical protein BDR07DRAFT_1406585 [Suillus spraguei]|nr:hypothetical protein BDR07DRAFT_1406585 [Suillus spraguei]
MHPQIHLIFGIWHKIYLSILASGTREANSYTASSCDPPLRTFLLEKLGPLERVVLPRFLILTLLTALLVALTEYNICIPDVANPFYTTALLFSSFHTTSNISTCPPRRLAFPSNSHFHPPPPACP